MAQSHSIYRPLQQKDDIRILLLASSPFPDAKLYGELKHENLTTDGLAYNAVSYVWADEDDGSGRFITIDKIDIKVKPNLFLLLKHLRSEHEIIPLWVDALCINQNNGREVEQQVAIMGNIYQKAECTFMWVGQMEHFGESTARLLTDLLDRASPNMSIKDYRRYCIQQNVKADEGWLGFMALLHRAYWRRVWIMQEILLSQRPVLCFGQHRICFKKLATLLLQVSESILMKDIMWDFHAINIWVCRNSQSKVPTGVVKWPPKSYTTPDFMEALMEDSGGAAHVILDSLLSSEHLGTGLAMNTARLYKGFDPLNRYDLLHALIETRNRQSSQDHDRIYGVLGLITGPQVVARYDISTNDLYTHMTFQMIQHDRNLDVLSACVHFRRRDDSFFRKFRPQRSNGLPSWVPDWRIYHHVSRGYVLLGRNACINFSAAGSTVPTASPYFDGNTQVLRIKGCKVGVISHISFPSTEYFKQPRQKTVRQMILDDWTYWCLTSKGKFEQAKHLSNSPLLRRLYRKLPLKPIAEHLYGDEEHQKIAFGKTYNLGVCDNHLPNHPLQYTDLPAPGPSFCPNAEFATEAYDRLLYACPTFFVTNIGHMGRGPYSVLAGDIIAILYGGKVPFVLRQKDTKFLLVGECYIAGFMNGEIMNKVNIGGSESEEFHLI